MKENRPKESCKARPHKGPKIFRNAWVSRTNPYKSEVEGQK